MSNYYAKISWRLHKPRKSVICVIFLLQLSFLIQLSFFSFSLDRQGISRVSISSDNFWNEEKRHKFILVSFCFSFTINRMFCFSPPWQLRGLRQLMGWRKKCKFILMSFCFSLPINRIFCFRSPRQLWGLHSLLEWRENT